jgi:hypothetical protein
MNEQRARICTDSGVAITLIIPTISRPTLARTLRSLRVQPWGPQDEIILVGDGPQELAADLWRQFKLPGKYIELPKTTPPDWGHTPRNTLFDQRVPRGTHIVQLDDDDQWVEGTLATLRAAVVAEPNRPHLFRQSGCPVTGTVWKVKQLTEGNIGTPCIIFPNNPEKIGRFISRYGGDCDFIADTCGRYPDGPVWHEEVIARIRPVT